MKTYNTLASFEADVIKGKFMYQGLIGTNGPSSYIFGFYPELNTSATAISIPDRIVRVKLM